MALPIALMAGAQVLGGLMGSSSAKKAAEAQAAATRDAAASQLTAARESNQLTSDVYRQGMANMAPQQYGSQLALSALLSGVGLGPLVNKAQTGTAFNPALGNYTNHQGQAVDAGGNVINTGSGLGNLNYGASNQELAAAANPYAGLFQEQFTGQDIYKDPSYDFRFNEGVRALRAQQAAGGNRGGDEASKRLVAFGQDYGSQEYDKMLGRYRLQKEDLYNKLSGMAGLNTGTQMAQLGQNAASTMGSNLMSGAKSASDYLTSGANAQAAGQVGSTQALVGGLSNAASSWYGNQLMNQMMNKPTLGSLNPYMDPSTVFGG